MLFYLWLWKYSRFTSVCVVLVVVCNYVLVFGSTNPFDLGGDLQTEKGKGRTLVVGHRSPRTTCVSLLLSLLKLLLLNNPLKKYPCSLSRLAMDDRALCAVLLLFCMMKAPGGN